MFSFAFSVVFLVTLTSIINFTLCKSLTQYISIRVLKLHNFSQVFPHCNCCSHSLQPYRTASGHCLLPASEFSELCSLLGLWLLNHPTSIYSSHPLPKSSLLKLHNIPYLRWCYAFKFWHMVIIYHLISGYFDQCPLFWVFSCCNRSSSIHWNVNEMQPLRLFWNLEKFM